MLCTNFNQCSLLVIILLAILTLFFFVFYSLHVLDVQIGNSNATKFDKFLDKYFKFLD